MSIAGAAADAKKTGDEIRQLSGLTDDIKLALLQIASKVAYIDEDGQDYYDALESALYSPAELVSISAVYTQSKTVYATDTLDGLKDDLVVTAHMSDSTTRPVTAYTLSGTLESGTSTITVGYGGKTTTFTVDVTARYTTYDYAVSKGTGANYVINTGIVFSPAPSVYNCRFTYNYDTPSTISGGSSYIGCRNSSSATGANSAFNFIMSTSTFAYHLLGKDSNNSIPNTTQTLHTVEWQYGDTSPSVLVVDSVSYTVATVAKANITSNTKSLCLLGSNKNGTIENGQGASYIKLGEVIFSDPNTSETIYDFVPAKDNISGNYGFYETVNKVFYGKSSTYVTCGNWS